jgi:hypothetical protein
MTKQQLDEWIDREANAYVHTRSSFEAGANLLAPLLLDAIEVMNKAADKSWDGQYNDACQILENALEKIEERLR